MAHAKPQDKSEKASKSAESVSFGHRRVSQDEKPNLVNAVFEDVAGNYDLMNDVMSAGVHRLWKAEFVKRIAPRPGQVALDVAGGTGDIALRLLKAGLDKITVCDPSADMMATGEKRALDKGILSSSAGGLDWVEGSAEGLPFEDNQFDLYTISFGLRNTTDRAAALSEARRVLKPGGQFWCLEFSQVQLPGFDKVYSLYSQHLIPRFGEWIAGNREAYQYLVDSIETFPTQEQLADEMMTAGLEAVSYNNLSGGIAAIHKGWKI